MIEVKIYSRKRKLTPLGKFLKNTIQVLIGALIFTAIIYLARYLALVYTFR